MSFLHSHLSKDNPRVRLDQLGAFASFTTSTVQQPHAMFSRKDRSAVLANDANNNTQPDGPRHSAVDTYGLRELHGPAEAIAECVFTCLILASLSTCTLTYRTDDPCNTSIILLHGLTGNRESTWTDKNSGVFWPSHLLNKDIPNSRILTWGYDADIAHFWAAASQNCIRNHAINLNNALAQFRERTETEERPIVFVTHSLGGLVFEDVSYLTLTLPYNHIPQEDPSGRTSNCIYKNCTGNASFSKQSRNPPSKGLQFYRGCLLSRNTALRFDPRKLGHDIQPDSRDGQGNEYGSATRARAEIRGPRPNSGRLPRHAEEPKPTTSGHHLLLRRTTSQVRRGDRTQA